jgi:hypothetical protein
MVTAATSAVALRDVSVPGYAVPLQGAAGCAKVTAKLGETTRSRYVIVHPASDATTLTMTVPNQFLFLGGSAPASVSNGTGPGIATVSLSSSNPSIASVPPSVQLMRGTAAFTIATKAEGCATITATLGSQTVRRTVQVLYIPG